MMLNSKNVMIVQKPVDRWLTVKQALERYPALWHLAYDGDEIALKLKYMAVFNGYDYRRWRMGTAYHSYFFRRSFLEIAERSVLEI